MRIIAGQFKARRLKSPEGSDVTRPLPDRVRTSLFSLLNGHYEGQAFCDFFAGTGAFGLEALSRGAASCLFVEKDREALKVLKENIASLGVEDRAEVFAGDALGAGALSRVPRPAHVILFDPPYPLMEDPAQRRRVFDQFVRAAGLLDDEGFALIRTPWPFVDHVERDNEPGRFDKVPVSLKLPELRGPETHEYGSTAVHWYMKRAATSGGRGA
jgi:16S rRNA (guanine(966)-N(2))-methyltransferase RsmD